MQIKHHSYDIKIMPRMLLECTKGFFGKKVTKNTVIFDNFFSVVQQNTRVPFAWIKYGMV